MTATDEDQAWARASARAALPRNQVAVRAMRASVAAGHHRYWLAVLVLLPSVVWGVAVLCWYVRAPSVAITVVAAGGSVVVGGFLVAFASRAWGERHLQPLTPLDRAARRSVRRQISGRDVVDPSMRSIDDVVAAGDYRRRVLIVPWTGLALTQLGRLPGTDDTLLRLLTATSGLLTLAAGWLFLFQAVLAARYVRRSR